MLNPDKLGQNWRQTIWREWRYCRDEEYGQRLYALVADTPVSWGSKLSLIVFSAVAGAALGIVIGAPVSIRWSVLQQLALAGMVIGGVRGYWLGRQLTWRNWLARLESNMPTDNPSALAGAAALLGLCGFVVFGPIFWLAMVGLFWAIGGVITWLNSGLENKPDYNPEDRRWWFWWRGRPHQFAVKAALEKACAELTTAREIWQEALQRLQQQQPAPPDTLIAALLSEDWQERFVARYTLVTVGREAVVPLQKVAEYDRTPLKDTVLWLLENIEQAPKIGQQTQESTGGWPM